MSREIVEMVRAIDLKQLESQLACQCAPLLTGLKASNLLITGNHNVKRVKEILANSSISYFILFSGEEETTLLLYKSVQLRKFLEREAVKKILNKLGYKDTSLQEGLAILAWRYSMYRNGNGDFPHEMGLFLEYPVEDVIGFIENEGRNFLCTGYWKVYANVAEKVSIFKTFEEAKEMLVRMVANGVKMEDIV